MDKLTLPFYYERQEVDIRYKIYKSKIILIFYNYRRDYYVGTLINGFSNIYLPFYTLHILRNFNIVTQS